jgi:hypothetical protein
MKRTIVLSAVLYFAALLAAPAAADMAAYVNAGVSNANPTIGLSGEFQYGYASVELGAGIMAYNDFGVGAGLRGYLFGIDGGPYLEVLYGTTAEKANTHKDSNDKEVVDSVEVFQGVSVLAGWRFFLADGWNMTFGAGAAQAGNKGLFVFNVTAGVMAWGDEAARKNAEKYRKSYEPPEPGEEDLKQEIPGPDEPAGELVPLPEMMTEPESITASAEAALGLPVDVTATAAPAGTTGAAGTK